MANELAKQSIKRYEGLRLTSYLCPAGKWTIGYGQTLRITKGMVWTLEQAERNLTETVAGYEGAIRAMCRPNTLDREIQAFISLAYNIGISEFRKSTVLRLHNLNKSSKDEMDKAFLMWIKATVKGKKVTLKGLVTRRWSEAQIYSSGVLI